MQTDAALLVPPWEAGVDKRFWLSCNIYDDDGAKQEEGVTFVVASRNELVHLKANLDSLCKHLLLKKDQQTGNAAAGGEGECSASAVCYRFPFQVIVTQNDSDKACTEYLSKTVESWRQTGGGNMELTVLHYPFHIAKPGLEHYCTPVQSVHSFVYLRQWTMQHAKFARVLRWDADFYMTADFALALQQCLSYPAESCTACDEWRFDVCDAGNVVSNEPRMVSLHSRPVYKKMQLWEVVEYLAPKHKTGNVLATARRSRNLSIVKSHYNERPWWEPVLSWGQGRGSSLLSPEDTKNIGLAESVANMFHTLRHFLPQGIQLYARGSDPKVLSLCHALPSIDEHLDLHYLVGSSFSSSARACPLSSSEQRRYTSLNPETDEQEENGSGIRDYLQSAVLPGNSSAVRFSNRDRQASDLEQLFEKKNYSECIDCCNRYLREVAPGATDFGKTIVESGIRWKALGIKRLCMSRLGIDHYKSPLLIATEAATEAVPEQSSLLSTSRTIQSFVSGQLGLVKQTDTRSAKHVFTITTCKRFSLFRETVLSFLTRTDALCPVDVSLPPPATTADSRQGGVDATLQSQRPKRWADSVWLCVDDNSSEEDRKSMQAEFPFFHFVFRNADCKGHRKGMNVLRDWVLTNCPACDTVVQLEDDWLFLGDGCVVSSKSDTTSCCSALKDEPTVSPTPGRSTCVTHGSMAMLGNHQLTIECRLPLLSQASTLLHSVSDLGQVLFNCNYDESPDVVSGGYSAVSLAATLQGAKQNNTNSPPLCLVPSSNTLDGIDHTFDRWLLHQHMDTSELRRLHPRNHGWWPHYSCRPGLMKTKVWQTVGRYEERYKNEHQQFINFEQNYAQRYTNKGYKTAFLDGFCCWHLGPKTWEAKDGVRQNAYFLNQEP